MSIRFVVSIPGSLCSVLDFFLHWLCLVRVVATEKVAVPKEETILTLYEAGKAGDWKHVAAVFAANPSLGAISARFVNPMSGWTLLHQAAFWKNEAAVKLLIRHGANINAKNAEKRTPPEEAIQAGSSDIAKLITDAAPGQSDLWTPRPFGDLLASSNAWKGATQMNAATDMRVAYGGGVVKIESGGRYWADAYGRVLVGWHGTYDPPCGMDGESMLNP